MRVIESASLETQQNNTCNGGGHKWPKTFWVVYFASWMLGMVGVIVWDLVLAEWAESMSVNLAAEMPFYEIHDYDFVLELELQRVKMVF